MEIRREGHRHPFVGHMRQAREFRVVTSGVSVDRELRAVETERQQSLTDFIGEEEHHLVDRVHEEVVAAVESVEIWRLLQ